MDQPSQTRRLPRLEDIARMLRFYSRLPVPPLPGEAEPHAPPDFARAAWALPIAGCLIAIPAVIALAAALALRLPGLAAATIAIAALVMTTGAFHEDGLADTADGFGGGATRERKLEIMKDSRIGAYGGAALVLSLVMRVALIAGISERAGALAAAAAMLAAACLSRPAGLVPLAALPPASGTGLSGLAKPPSQNALAAALLIAGLLTGAFGALGGLPPAGSVLGAFGALAAGAAVTYLSARQIQGQTGDVAGAAQQAAEIVFLTIMLICLPL